MDPEAASLSETLGNIPAETARLSIDTMRRVERRDYYVNVNWKVYIDNYLEGYHVPVAHPGLYRELDYANYRVTSPSAATRRPATVGAVQRRDQ